MRWIFLMIAVFLVCDGLVISYWRQTGDGDALSGATVLTHLLLIPLVIVTTVYGLHRLIQWRIQQREKAQAQSLENPNNQPSLKDPSMPWLHVHHIALQTYLGDETASLIEGLRTLDLPNMDAELCYLDKSIASRRIELNIDTANSSGLRSDRAQRIWVISQRLLESIDPTLALVAEHIALNQPMTTPLTNSSQHAILHPAWYGQSVVDAPLSASESMSSSWSQVALQIVCALPAHLDIEEQTQIQRDINQYLAQYQFTMSRIQITHEIVNDADESLSKINQYTAALADNSSPQLLLLLGMDSTLDQDWLDDQIHMNIPAEAGFSILLSNQTATLPELAILAHLTQPITTNRQKPISALGQNNAETLLTLLTELSLRYKMPEVSLVPELGLLITDTSATIQSAHSIELAKVFDQLKINMNQTGYAGNMLESTNTMMSGIAIALAIQHAKQSTLHTPIVCSAGQTVRSVWLAMPVLEPTTITAQSQDLPWTHKINHVP